MIDSVRILANRAWPLGFRWFVANQVTQLQPWWFLDVSDPTKSDPRFSLESIEARAVVAFARRYDRDDFAGFELIDGRPTERVLVYHPSFGTSKNSGLVVAEHASVFEFFGQVVVRDSQEWASEGDLADLPNCHDN